MATLAGTPGVRQQDRSEDPGSPILRALAAEGARPSVTYRQQGDRNLLIEYGPIVLDLELRLRVHALMLEIERPWRFPASST